MGKPNVVRGMVAGAAGGLIASWVMNVFLAGSSKAQDALKTPDEKEEAAKQQANAGDDSTEKVASAIGEAVGQPLTQEQKEAGGPIVHYVFGSLMGAAYGVVAEYVPSTTLSAPVVFGSALFLGADEVAVPALGLASPGEEPVSSQVNYWAAHVVYGLTVDLVRRGLLRVL